VILGIRSYQNISNDHFTQAIQTALGVAKSILFVGVGSGLEDPNWLPWQQRMADMYAKGSEYRHYRLCRTAEMRSLSEGRGNSPIFPIPIGDRFDQLGPFLRELAYDAGVTSVDATAPASDVHVSAHVRVGLGVIVRDRKVVLLQRRRMEGDLEWGFPAGFIKPRHDAREVICADVREETGLQCRIVTFYGERVHPATQLRCVYYRLNVLDGELINGDSDENLDARWVDIARIEDFIDPSAIYPPVLESLREELS
jgi:ADP-ribose pyrophosphatase YjhB (NUDIX family)